MRNARLSLFSNDTDRKGLEVDCTDDDCDEGYDPNCDDPDVLCYQSGGGGGGGGGSGSGSVNYSSSQIVGYDPEGNPIIGDPNIPTTVNVNANGQTITITFDSSSCPAGQVLMGNGTCDVPIYGWLGNGQQVLVGVYNTSAPLQNPCTIIFFYAASAGAAAGATVNGTAVVATAETYGVPTTAAMSWLRRLPASLAVGIGNGIQKIGSAVQSACNSMANW